MLARTFLRTDPLEKGTDHSGQGGPTPSFFLPHAQNIVGVGHMTIANLLGDVSGLYAVIFR